MEVFRTIHPVGHGGFFTEELCEGNDCFNVVYDCGTRNGLQLLEREINKAFNRKQSVDLLFISHFDRDHVSGLKELVRRNLLNSGTKVVMPFHYPSYFVILNPFLYAYYEQCMLILRSTGTTIVEVEEQNPSEDEYGRYLDRRPHASYVSFEQLRGSISSGSRISLSPKWIYIPFNLNDSKNFADRFEDEVKRQLGMDINDMSPMDLEQNADIIRGIYQLMGKKNARSFNINSNSLIVISMPTGDVDSCYTTIAQRKYVVDAATAVYTGDSYLKDFTNGSLPFRYYSASKRVLGKYVHYPVGLFQIPHHGSNNNYDFQLQNEAALCQFAFCSQDDRDKMQGTTRYVCNDLGGIAKVMLHVVDENGGSEIVQEIVG